MYRHTSGSMIERVSDGLRIPQAEGNKDYADVQEWLAQGNVLLPALEQPVMVPEVVSMRQARIALHRAGHLATVNAAVSVMPAEAQIEWEYATEVRRDNGLTAALAALLSLDDAALDSLFVTASQI